MRECCQLIAAVSWCVIASWCVANASAASTTTTPTPVATSVSSVKVANESQEAQAQEQVAILKQINRVNNDGSYTYGYEAADGSFKIETRDVTGTVKGMFGFIDENGQLKRVTYSASNNTGFQSSPTTSPRPAPIYRPHPSTTANPPPVYRTTASSIQAIPRVGVPSSIQSIPRVTLPRLRRPGGSSTTASPVSRRPVVFVRPPGAQVTETPEEASRGSTSSPTTEPVLVRKVLVNRRPVVVGQTESPILEGKLEDDGTTKGGNHQGNALRRQLGAERGYGGLPQQFLRLRQQAGGTDDSGDVYGGAGVGRPIAGSPYRGGAFNPNQPRVVQEAILQGQQQGYAPTQRVPLGNFNELDPRVQARILNSVDPRIQARILNSLDPSVRAEIFRAAEADMRLPFGVLQNQLDPTNPSNPNVPVGFARGSFQRDDPRLGQGVRGPYVNPLNDPRNVATSADDLRIRGGLNGVDGMFPSRAYPEAPLRSDNYTGGNPQILQMFLNQQDPRLGVAGYQSDYRYAQDPQARGQVPQDPRQIAAYYSRLRGRFNQDPRQGNQDPRVGGSYFQDPRFGGGYSNQDPRLAAGYSQDPRVAAGYQEDPRDAAGYSQDPRVTSGYSQDPRVTSGYSQDPRVTSGYSQDPRVTSGYSQDPLGTGRYQQQDDMALRIPLNPRLPFGNPRLRPDNQQDFTLMQQLLQVLLARAQLQRLQQQQLQQQQLQRTQYRRPSNTLTPFQKALLSTLEPNAPELLEQMMNQLTGSGPQQFPATYDAGEENDPRYQQVYPDTPGSPYPTQDGARGAYDQRQFGFQTPQYRRRFRYRPRYMPMPTYQDGGSVQYYQGPQGFTDYQEPQEYAGYQQTQQTRPLQQQNLRYVRPTPLQDPQVFSRQPEAYSGSPGSVRSYQDLPPEYREAILLRMILASRSRAQQYQDQTQNILQQSIGASSAVSSTTTPAPTSRDSRTFSPVRNVQILDTTATESNAKRSTESATATPKK